MSVRLLFDIFRCGNEERVCRKGTKYAYLITFFFISCQETCCFLSSKCKVIKYQLAVLMQGF